MRHEEWLQFEGLAKAVVSTAFRDAISGGRHGRIGFAAFTWSRSGRFEVAVPWTLIESTGDAARVATALRSYRVDRSPWAYADHDSGGRSTRSEFRTDISGTIDFATTLASIAPYAAPRTVINICTNGRDNVGPGPRSARDRAIATGMAINGLILGSKEGLAGYFREQVQGGAGSFVIEVARPAALVEAMVDKPLRDPLAARSPPALTAPFT
jgi:hypothetical protein